MVRLAAIHEVLVLKRARASFTTSPLRVPVHGKTGVCPKTKVWRDVDQSQLEDRLMSEQHAESVGEPLVHEPMTEGQVK